MKKIETTVRKTPFILRTLLLLCWMLAFFMFLFNPAIHGSDKDETAFQLLFLGFTLAGIFLTYLYFKIPKVPVTLMILKDNELSFTSMTNPAFGIGEHYKENYTIDIDDILYVCPYFQYIHRVGSFFCITFYCQQAGVFPTYYGTEHRDELVELLDDLLIANKNIKIVNIRDFAITYFPKYEARMIPEIPDGYYPDGSSRRILFPEKYSEEDWHRLLLAPFQVFKAVAIADGQVDKWESRTLISLLKSAGEQRSFLVADLLKDASTNVDSLLDKVMRESATDLQDILSGAIRLVERDGDKIDQRDFRYMLASFARAVAESSGLGKQRISKQEQNILDKIETSLGLKGMR